VDQVRETYAAAYPEIVTASVEGPEAVGNKLVYRFSRAIGSKG
jgi:PRTRC genetic system protein C